MVLLSQQGLHLVLPQLERIRDVLQKDQPEHRVLVNSGIEIGTQFIVRGPELLIEIVQEFLCIGHFDSSPQQCGS